MSDNTQNAETQTADSEAQKPRRVSIKDSAYDDAVADAKKDDRLGRKDWQVTEIIYGAWPSGDSYTKYMGVILGTGGSKADLVLTELRPPEEITAEARKAMDRGERYNVEHGLLVRRQLCDFYALEYADDGDEGIKVGDIFAVVTKLNKNFVRVDSFRPKSAISSVGVTTAAVPF